MTNLRIITWNANGLANKQHELEMFLYGASVDIALLSETHFTNRSYLRVRNYVMYKLHSLQQQSQRRLSYTNT